MDYSFVAKHLKEIGFEMRLLLVEDDPLLQKQLQSFLQRFFKTIDIASDGVEAIMLYQANPYDLVVTDLTMPVMSGTELAANIRELNPRQRIVIISGDSGTERLLELINIGIDAFIVKPLKMNEVLIHLERTCQAVYDQKMLDYFSTMLEESNRELRDANFELSWLSTNTSAISATLPRNPAPKPLRPSFPRRRASFTTISEPVGNSTKAKR